MNNKKIAFVIYDLSDGGAERVVALLSKEMSKYNNVSIIVFDSLVNYEFGGKLINLDLPSSNNKILKVLNLFYRALKLKSVFKKNQFDRIYSFMESSNIPALLASPNTIVSIRNNPMYMSKMHQFFIRKLYKRANKIIVNSEKNKQILDKNFNLNNVDVIYNPIDFNDIKMKSLIEIEEKEEFIVAMGRLVNQKGFDLLIRAFYKLQNASNMKLLIFGEGNDRKKLEELIKELNLEDRVFLRKRIDNPYKYLAKAKIFVLSSRYEGFPNVLIEALSCSLPTVSFNCETGPSEIIEHEENGLLVEKENVDALAASIDRLCMDEDLLNKITVNAFKSISYLNKEKITNKWYKIGVRNNEK